MIKLEWAFILFATSLGYLLYDSRVCCLKLILAFHKRHIAIRFIRLNSRIQLTVQGKMMMTFTIVHNCVKSSTGNVMSIWLENYRQFNEYLMILEPPTLIIIISTISYALITY